MRIVEPNILGARDLVMGIICSIILRNLRGGNHRRGRSQNGQNQ